MAVLCIAQERMHKTRMHPRIDGNRLQRPGETADLVIDDYILFIV